jgi:DnaJ family protein C protein 13
MVNVLYLIKTQNLIYRRFAEAVAPQKYPAYPLLISVLVVPPLDPPVEGLDADILLAGTLLMYYTSNISPLNAKEFVKVGAVTKLHEIIQYAIKAYDISATQKLAAELLLYGMKTLTALANFDGGRDALLGLCPQLADDIHTVIEHDKEVPVATENAIEVVSRASQHPGLQQFFVNAGIVWQLVPMLLGYDGTLQEDYSDESQRMLFNQTAANVHAVLAAKALGRLAGVMFDELASPLNEEVKKASGQLLTQPLAKLLRNRRPWELLCSLNENCEKATKIWNVGMRKELTDFVAKQRKIRPPGSRNEDLQAAAEFTYTALREELCVGGVYVRIFNKNGDTNDIDDPSQFCRELVAFVWSFLSSPAVAANVSAAHQDQSIEGLKVLARGQDYVPVDIANCPNGLQTVFQLLSARPQDSASFGSSAELMSILCNTPDFIVATCASPEPVAWRLLQACCTCAGQHVGFIWQATELFSSHPDGLAKLFDFGAIPHMLSLIFGVPGYSNGYSNRLAAISLLSKCLSNPVKGQEASAMLRRFLPEPVVLLLRAKAGSSSLKVMDDVVENPELIWTAEMQGELRTALTALVSKTHSKAATAAGKLIFDKPLDMDLQWVVVYRQLANELYVGGVYIRLYLKQPTFHLTNPIFFAEKLIEFWESSFNVQVPKNAKVGTLLAHVLVFALPDLSTVVFCRRQYLLHLPAMKRVVNWCLVKRTSSRC